MQKTLRIYTDVMPMDWLSFHEIYSPILSFEAINLYKSLYFQKQINQQLSIETYDYFQFLKNNHITEDTFKKALSELENLNLSKLSAKSHLNSMIEFSIKVKNVKSVKEAFKDESLNKKIKNKLTSEKYKEISLALEDKKFGYEISLNKVSEPQEDQECMLDTKTYCDFYTGVFKNLGSEFSLCNEVLSLIKEYYLVDQKITMEKLHKIASLSAREKEGKYFIDPKNFSFLTKLEIEKPSSTFDQNKYDEFWRSLLTSKNPSIKKTFNELFSSYEPENLYKLLTNKNKVPSTLSSWIKSCIQNKSFSYLVINASISFVNTLLGKVPVNYLIKLSETLIEREAIDFSEFINHIKKVIINDSENKNRLNAKVPYEKEEKEDLIFFYRES